MLERKETRKKRNMDRRRSAVRPWRGQAEGPERRNGVRRGGREGIGGEGDGRAAPDSQVRHLGGPGPSAGPAKCPPGRLAARAGSQLHLDSRRGLKNRVAGAVVWKQGPAVIRGGPGPCTGTFYKACGYKKKKKNQNKPLSSGVGRENKSCLLEGAEREF